MINRPNFNNIPAQFAYRYIGDNNLRREFTDCFSIILSSCYEDDTKNSRFFNKFSEDGTSYYYVHQPEIEEKLDEFSHSPVDSEKFLIGFTGIGKTTLLKNYFKIKDSDPFFSSDKCLVAYYSVYSDDILNETSLKKNFCSYLETVVLELLKRTQFDSNNPEDQQVFLEYVESRKARLVVDEISFNGTRQDVAQRLKRFRKEHPLDYYAALIGFIVSKCNKEGNCVNELVLIYDDIESRPPELHIPIISMAQDFSAKLRESDGSRKYIVKTIISLRNYTFRYNYARHSDARRNYSEDVILKDCIPTMKDIFSKRFNVYYENDDVRAAISNEIRWNESVNLLYDVVNNIANFGETISAIANYDIAHSLKLFLRVLSNHRWFAPNETYYQGAYDLKPENYLPIKERLYKALAYGEGYVYSDGDDTVLPNIIRFHEESDEENVELMSLYVMEYMLYQSRTNNITLYGEHSIEGKKLKDSIVKILNCPEESENAKLVDIAIERLYMQRCLLQSIFQAEADGQDKTHNHHRRKYDSSYKLYLSLRGNKLMELLENDSLLLEFYRDDIDTELSGNEIPSSEMLQTEKLIYLINICKQLFEKEQLFIRDADKKKYFRCFGGGFVTTRLLKGIANTYKYYYKRQDTKDAISVKNALANTVDAIKKYKASLIDDDPSLRIHFSLESFT